MIRGNELSPKLIDVSDRCRNSRDWSPVTPDTDMGTGIDIDKFES